jgi:hypothetical protein
MSTAQQAILAVMNEVQAVAKTGRNTSQGFNFRGIDAVMNAVGPAFRKHGLFIVPTVVSNVAELASTTTGKQVNIVRLNVEFAIYGQEGDPIVGCAYGEAADSSDKAGAKAHSVAYRTFLLQVLCLPTDEPDPDSQTYELGAAVPTVAGLKTAIAKHFRGKPKEAITAALEAATGKAADWSVEELAGFLDALEAAK